MPNPLANAGRYLTTGHPAYRADWLAFMQSVTAPLTPTSATDARTEAMLRLVPELTPPMLTRAIIRSLNGLNPHSPSRPASQPAKR